MMQEELPKRVWWKPKKAICQYTQIFKWWHQQFLLLLLWKVFYGHEYIYNSQKFTATLLPEKVDIYSHLNEKGITDAN